MSADHRTRALRERVSRLERESRFLRRTVVAVLVLLLLPLAAFHLQEPGQPDRDPETIRARGYDVVDRSGATRARFAVSESGHPELRVMDARGEVRLRIGLGEEGHPLILLRDATGTPRIGIMTDRRDNPQLLLSEKGGKPRAQMAVAESGAPSLLFMHRDGRMPAGIGVHADGDPWLRPAPEEDK